MRIGEKSKIDDKRKVIHGDGAVFPEAGDQNGDPEKQLIIAQQQNESFDDRSPEGGPVFADAQKR